MKRILLAFLITAVLAGAAYAESFKRVVLYQDIAFLTVERSAAGNRLVIDCPPELALDSVVVVPAPGLHIRSTSIEPKRLMSGKAKNIKEALAGKKAELEEKRRRQKTVERQIELIFDAAGARDKEAPFSRTSLSDALVFIDEKVDSLNGKHIRLGREIEDLSLMVKDLEEQLGEVSRKQGYEITVETDKDGVIRVSYAVKNGSWKPEYAVHADSAGGKLRIDAKAVIRQATGTDWEAEELMVATGMPGYGIHTPELSPWYIGMPRYKRSVIMEKSAVMSNATQADEMDQDFDTGVKATAVSYIMGAVEAVTLPGDGTPASIILQRKTMEAVIERLTCPRIDSGVFLRAQAVWNGTAPILAGTYNVYVDGEFTGGGTIRPAQPGEKLVIDLGRDEGITVERVEKAFHEKTLTGKDKTVYTSAVTVRNTRSYPVRVTLKDQIPVSQDEAVRVELVESSPEAAPDKDGILTWVLDCAPETAHTVTFAFSITGMPPL